MTSVKELEPAGTLPPGVRGAQRGELLLSIDELALAAPWASGACGVRIKWWGEPGDGTVLLPSQPGCAPQTPTGYAISCGPEQLARYLADMRVLVLDVLDLAAPAPHALGHAYLHLSEAQFGAPLCETLAVYTEAEEELAQLRVSLLVRFAPGAGASLNSSVELPSRLPHRLSSRPLSGSVRDSFVLNEKRAMFDASHKLPMLGRESPAPFESPGGTLQPLEEALPPVASGRETPVDGMMAVEAPEPVSPFSAAVAAADAAAAAADATAAIADAAAADASPPPTPSPPPAAAAAEEEARQAPPHWASPPPPPTDAAPPAEWWARTAEVTPSSAGGRTPSRRGPAVTRHKDRATRRAQKENVDATQRLLDRSSAVLDRAHRLRASMHDGPGGRPKQLRLAQTTADVADDAAASAYAAAAMEPAFARIDAELVAFAEKGAELLPAAAEAPPPMPTMRALPGAAAPPPPLASVVRLIKEQEAEVATGRETPLSGEMQIEVQLGRARLAPAGAAAANVYVVCRLCPLLLEAAVETARGVSEGGQLRTEVSWGTDAPQFGFRHTARLSSAGCAAARGEPQELVLEMWRLSGDTQAEELVGLVRSPLRLPTTAAMLGTRLYASSLVDGDEPIVHPLDGLARGELRVRVRVGTADQILRTRTLTGAVEVIQTAWRARRGDKREVAAAEAAANAAAQKAAAVWAAAAAAAAEAAAPPGTFGTPVPPPAPPTARRWRRLRRLRR